MRWWLTPRLVGTVGGRGGGVVGRRAEGTDLRRRRCAGCVAGLSSSRCAAKRLMSAGSSASSCASRADLGAPGAPVGARLRGLVSGLAVLPVPLLKKKPPPPGFTPFFGLQVLAPRPPAAAAGSRSALA